MSGRAAVRTDESGAVERAGYFADGLFGVTHVPAQPTGGGVLMCPPIHAEFTHNYRGEVLLARALAARGLAVQRFHYRGFGNSCDAAATTIDAMVSDASQAADHLAELAGVDRLAVLGTRWGALVAGAVSRRTDAAPLALWEPIVQPMAYFREALRAGLIYDLHRASRHSRPLADLDEGGDVEVLGYRIDPDLYASSSGLTLTDLVGADPRAVLIVQISQHPTLRPELAGLASQWTQGGFAVEITVVREEQAWWFANSFDGPPVSPGLASLTDVTESWLASRLVPNEVTQP